MIKFLDQQCIWTHNDCKHWKRPLLPFIPFSAKKVRSKGNHFGPLLPFLVWGSGLSFRWGSKLLYGGPHVPHGHPYTLVLAWLMLIFTKAKNFLKQSYGRNVMLENPSPRPTVLREWRERFLQNLWCRIVSDGLLFVANMIDLIPSDSASLLVSNHFSNSATWTGCWGFDNLRGMPSAAKIIIFGSLKYHHLKQQLF